MFFTKIKCSLKKSILNIFEDLRHLLHKLIQIHALSFRTAIPSSHKDCIIFQITGTNFYGKWDSLLDPLPVLLSPTQITIIPFHPDRTPCKL